MTKATGYFVDHEKFEIIISKKFGIQASQVGTREYDTLKALKDDFPDFSVRRKVAKKRSKRSTPTYDQMVKYISCLNEQTLYLKMFSEVRDIAKSKNNPYNYVLKWFTNSFPDYGKPLKFDRSGNVIATVNIEVEKDCA